MFVKGNVLHYHIVFINQVPGCDRVAIDLARVIDFLYLFRYRARQVNSERERASAYNEPQSYKTERTKPGN
jgi:hypothetical protein